MKVKEIDRTANIAWSPAAHHPIYLAAGTAAQQLDATFSTTAALEIYALNLTEPGLDMCMKGSVVSDFRFHKIVWGSEGMSSNDQSSGVIVGGADGGNIMMYDAAKLIQGDSALLHQTTKHTGPVHSLDFNNFQSCLLASGASESEIFIWDLNNPSAPVTLGAKSQPLEDVTCVSWNCQVQHILASTFPARCVVWDLRKNEPIIKVSDSTSRLRCKVVCWHPEVATQMCIASEDDHSPVIQLWDLRFATSPLKTLEHHQRGVLSIAWCPQDPDLLLSCGKDNRILCWNPNSNVENGEVLCELPTGNQWSFDVAWCPRNPAVIANSTCDGHVSVFSLMGGQQQVQCSSKIAESFPGSDTMIQPPNVTESLHRQISVPLQKPPKWVRKPVGASFGFGGKLVYFVNDDPSGGSQSGEYPTSKIVHISQVVTEPDLLKNAERLESSLANGNLVEFCQNKIDNSMDEQERMTWNFLAATFQPGPRGQMLTLLGYNYEKVMNEINSVLKDKGVSLDNQDFNNDFANLTTSEIPGDGAMTFDNIAMTAKEDEEPVFIETNPADTDGLISRALLTGHIASAVDICIQNNRWADALVLAQTGGEEILAKTQRLYFKSASKSNASKLISAVVTSDWLTMVKNCDLSCWKEVLAAILAYAKPEDFSSLCQLLGNRLERVTNLQPNAALCYISAGNLELMAESWLKRHEKLDNVALQSLIERVMIMRRSVEHMSGSVPPLETGTLSLMLGQYAELLATQGSLHSAITYLVDPNERTLAILRDRIYQSLGHRSPLFPFQRVDVRRSSSLSQAPTQFAQKQPNLLQERRTSSSSNPPLQPQYSYGGPTQSISNSFGYSSPTTTSQYPSPLIPPVGPPAPPVGMMQPLAQPVAPVVAPPPVEPPTSERSRQNSGGPHHLSQRYPRHLHDPSVYTENTYASQQQFYQPQSFPQPQSVQPTAFYNPAENNNISGNASYPPLSNSGPTFQPPTPYNNYSNVPQTPYSPPAVTPPVTSAPLASSYNDVKPGWNDPPLIKKQSIKTPTTNYEPPMPITRPFPDLPPVEPQMPLHSNHNQNYFQAQYIPQTPNIANPNTYVPNQMPEPPKPVPQKVPEIPKEKGLIPPEHQVLQDIFEDLRRQCQQVATNPQTRRKLDDVAKKLENLYDKLRDDSLSNQVTSGLHQIVQGIMQSDYSTALGIHGQLVATSNFSEISGFMPSLKVLLQTASQLNVYLQ